VLCGFEELKAEAARARCDPWEISNRDLQQLKRVKQTSLVKWTRWKPQRSVAETWRSHEHTPK
jgi:hypothetical protein